MDNNTKKSFNVRAFASVFAGISFLLMAVTGLVLFFAPSCRIARDTSWAVWGHNKDQWIAVHIWLSIACLIASIIHIYLNWTVLTNYFKSRIHKGLAFRTEWIAALLICVILYGGSVRGVAPFSSLMIWKETFKHGAAESGQGRRRGGIAGQPVQYRAKHAEKSYSSGEPASNAHQGDCEQNEGMGNGPGRGGAGMGRKTLRQFCGDEGIELAWAVSHLKNQGLTVQDTMTIRQIADAFGVHPREMRAVLQSE